MGFWVQHPTDREYTDIAILAERPVGSFDGYDRGRLAPSRDEVAKRLVD